MRRRLGNWSTRLAGALLGVWVADLLLPGVRFDGPLVRTLLALLVVAALVVIATVAVAAPGYRLLRAAMRRAEESFDRDSWQRVDPIHTMWVINAAHVAYSLAVWAFLAPLAFLLAARLGAGMTVDGYRVAMAAALVTAVVWPLARWPLHRPRLLVREIVTIALTLAALVLARALLGGVFLEPGPGWAQWLTMVVLAMLYHVFWFELSVPLVTVLFRLALAGLKLWGLSWVSGATLTPLRIEGFWSFLVTAVVVVVLLWPLRLFDARRRQQQQALDELQWHMDMQQQMLHQTMQRPFY